MSLRGRSIQPAGRNLSDPRAPFAAPWSGELAELAGVSAANTSQHLTRLLNGDIVARRREGTSIRYRIVDETIGRICTIVCARLDERPVARTACAAGRR